MLDNLTTGLKPKAVAVLQLQLLIIIMLLASFLQVFLRWDWPLYIALQGVISLAYLAVIFFEVRKKTAPDFKAYAFFFLGLLAIIQASLGFGFYQQALLLSSELLLGLIIVLFAFVLGFRVFFGRNYTMGTVLLCSNKLALVETDFDLRAFTLTGKYSVAAKKKFPEGAKVKLKVKTGFLSRKPAGIVSKL